MGGAIQVSYSDGNMIYVDDQSGFTFGIFRALAPVKNKKATDMKESNNLQLFIFESISYPTNLCTFYSFQKL
jgi:hypothetical protein